MLERSVDHRPHEACRDQVPVKKVRPALVLRTIERPVPASAVAQPPNLTVRTQSRGDLQVLRWLRSGFVQQRRLASPA